MNAAEMIAHARAVRARLHRPPNAWVPPNTATIVLAPIWERRIAMEVILHFVSDNLHVSVADICGKSRFKHIVRARHLVCYIAHDCLKIRIAYISRFLGRDHTSVMHSIGHMSLILLEDNECVRAIEEFRDLYQPAFAIPSIYQPNMAQSGPENPYQRRVRKMENGRWRTVIVPAGLPSRQKDRGAVSPSNTSDET